MKLEEVLPAYRDGKVIISQIGDRFQIEEKGAHFTLIDASEKELLGDWTIEKKKVKKEVRGWLNIYPDGLGFWSYKTKEEADDCANSPIRIACVEFVHEYEVEE